MIKPFRVDFEYVQVCGASLYVCAETEDAAREGAKQMLANTPAYQDPEITSVNEYKPPVDETEPTVN